LCAPVRALCQTLLHTHAHKTHSAHAGPPVLRLSCTQLEVEEMIVRPRREPLRLVVSRPRIEFNQAFRHYDKDAHELWNSSQMECRCVGMRVHCACVACLCCTAEDTHSPSTCAK